MKEDQQQKELVGTARTTGVWYLMLGISGMVGFLMLHARIYVGDDPSKTLTNLIEHETLARIRLLFEFLIVITQALTAVWFYKLFKDIRHVAAWALAAWGMMNAVAIMISAMAMAGAVNVAHSTQFLNDKMIMIQIFDQFIKNAWGVGNLFFGLWLIPMGYAVASSQRMPVWLGRVLMLGGVGYILSAFINYIGVSGAWAGILTIPATIGEFWMIAYLLIFGIRPDRPLQQSR
ncbi:MAG TPA: DUF4386 domain-containing protein [Cyclobacteriaceae bacterium]|nr:DUF4386 domain-containing protein [Cyclobacteriaceae bacterium]